MTIPRVRVAPGRAKETRLAASSVKTNSSAKVARKVTAVTTFEPCSKANRAATWLLPKTTEMQSSSEMPAQRGIGLPCNARDPFGESVTG